jgi:GT2 family glycosyltransferase
MEPQGSPQPLVSVGIPLYRSRRFLQIIIENIEAIDYPNVEIIVSDRHLFDDTVELLKQRFGSDTRFTFLEGRDELNWVENFNLLMRQSRGKYFVSMAHDDSFPSNYVSQLVSALEERPDAVMAFARVEQLSVDGFLPTFPFSNPPISEGEPWSINSSLRLLTLWQLWIAFRGMVRREVIQQWQLYVRQTYKNIRADIYWVFGLSLKGPLVFVPSVHCTKRFYRSSAGAGWRFGVRQSLNACAVLQSYIRDYSASPKDARIGLAVTWLWCLVQGFLPATLARRLGIVTRRILLRPARRSLLNV